MTVKELEEYLKNVKDKSQSVYFYHCDDNPFDDGIGVENAFEVLRDQKNIGVFEGVYLKGNWRRRGDEYGNNDKGIKKSGRSA